MSTDDRLEVFMANLELHHLNQASRGMQERPITLEVSKAATLAMLHPNIEARVICKTLEDATDALLMLGGRICDDLRGKWSIKERSLELTNGSAVVVKFEPTSEALDALMAARVRKVPP
jgi:hypothetical protein